MRVESSKLGFELSYDIRRFFHNCDFCKDNPSAVDLNHPSWWVNILNTIQDGFIHIKAHYECLKANGTKPLKAKDKKTVILSEDDLSFITKFMEEKKYDDEVKKTFSRIKIKYFARNFFQAVGLSLLLVPLETVLLHSIVQFVNPFNKHPYIHGTTAIFLFLIYAKYIVKYKLKVEAILGISTASLMYITQYYLSQMTKKHQYLYQFKCIPI